jgi:hypothetical protein
MKNIARCLLVMSMIIVGNHLYAQEWIPYQPSNHILQTTVTQQSYVYQPQPIIVYQYVPYVVNQPVVVEQRCLLYRTQRVVYVPQTQYFYQPVVIYR